MTSHIKLHGGKGERFETIKDQLIDELGYEPTNTEVVGFLMANYPAQASMIPKAKN